MGPCLLLNPLPIFWWPKKRPVFAKALPRSARWAYLRSWASKTGSPGCPWVPLRSLVRYGGFHSHGATPTAGWFISWKIHGKSMGCCFWGEPPSLCTPNSERMGFLGPLHNDHNVDVGPMKSIEIHHGFLGFAVSWPSTTWLVVDLPLWKIMEWVSSSVGMMTMMTFPICGKS